MRLQQDVLVALQPRIQEIDNVHVTRRLFLSASVTEGLPGQDA
jgi:hypothetical protein